MLLARRLAVDGAQEIRPSPDVSVEDVLASGTYRSATESGHAIYESRLLFSDFDVGVQRIVAQPFLLRFSIDGKERRNIPDYLLLTNAAPVIRNLTASVGTAADPPSL